MELGDRVKELRERAGLTQEELAEKMGVQRNTVWRWENKKATLRAENIQRLSSVLNIDASSLMENTDTLSLSPSMPTSAISPTFCHSLAYWGEVADNARAVAANGDKEEIADVSHLLTRALASLHVAGRESSQPAMA